jgi:predicted dehydrogenase/L-amino acid N-acyltransferase YncA
VRVAVLGQGSIGRRHAAILQQLGCDVVPFDPAVPGEATSEEAALRAADAAVVASPSSEHERHAVLALRAGVPVLVEKPLALDAAGAARIGLEAEMVSGILDVAMNLRHHPGILKARDLAPEIGRIVRASAWCGSWLPGWRDSDYRHSYSAQRSLGGGVLLDAIHEIDYMLWLLGPSSRATGVASHVSSLEIDVEDVAMVHVEHASGTLTSITLDYVDRTYHRGCRLVGEMGTVDWDWTRGTVRLHRADGSTIESSVATDVGPTYVSQMRRFLGVVRGEARPLVSIADARAALEVVDAIRGDEIGLRPARQDDQDRLLEWRNEPTVRAASRSTGEIAPDEHARWYKARLLDPGTRIFIVEHRGEPIGQIRVNHLDESRGEMHIAISSAARGRGLAAPAIRRAACLAAGELELGTLIAEVREDNVPSLRAFARAGFIQQRATDGWRTLAWSRVAR